MKQHIRAAIAIAMVVALAAASSRAADLYWSGAGTWDTTNANWGTGPGGPYDAATWNNATPDTATFEGTAGTVTLGEAITVGGLIFYDAGYTIASNTLTFGADGSITANADAEIASDLAGGVALTKAGDGTLVLSAANTFSGALTLGAGTLLLTHPNAIAASSGLTLVTGSTLALRSDTSATFTTPSFATLAYPAGAAAVDVNNNGAGSDNTLTLSGGLGSAPPLPAAAAPGRSTSPAATAMCCTPRSPLRAPITPVPRSSSTPPRPA